MALAQMCLLLLLWATTLAFRETRPCRLSLDSRYERVPTILLYHDEFDEVTPYDVHTFTTILYYDDTTTTLRPQ